MAAGGYEHLTLDEGQSLFRMHAARLGPVEIIHYGFTKTADVVQGRRIAKRMADTGVTVNSVLPGPTL